MTVNIYRSNWIAALIPVFFTFVTRAQDNVRFPFLKDIPVTTETRLKAVNEQGDIRIIGWDRQSVKIEVTLREGKDGSILHESDVLTPQVSQTPHEIEISLQWENQSDNWFSSWVNDKIKNLTKPYLWVGYTFYLPKKMDLNLKNEFGDISIESWNGKLYIDQEHGNLVVDGQIANATGTMKFVEAQFGSVSEIKMDLKQVKLKANTIEVFDAESVGGVYEISDVNHFTLTSARDEIRIHRAGTCRLKSNFSEIIIEELSKASSFDVLFGSLEISGFNGSVVPLEIDQRSSQVSVFVGEMPFEFKGQVEGGTLRLPLSTEILLSEALENKKKGKKIHARYGNGKGEAITLISKNGNVIFKNQ